uniref:Proteolipid protein 1a n=1 Tax=Astyanax mexicanus TaxID=7994 RepID=A0A8B9LS37_ASTMX
YTILYYTILYYTILYYTILYYTILYYTGLYCTILYYTTLWRFGAQSSLTNIEYFQYIIYGLATFFFLYCIALLAEGFYTTSAARQTFGEFRSTVCGRCLSTSFIVITYFLAVVWLLVFALSALPVFFFYNMSSTCRTVDVLSETPSSINQLCVDARQYGLLPWNAMPGKACGMTLSNVCKTREFFLTYDLYIAAFAGAGITLLALVSTRPRNVHHIQNQNTITQQTSGDQKSGVKQKNCVKKVLNCVNGEWLFA